MYMTSSAMLVAWSAIRVKDFLKAGKKRLKGDTEREANSSVFDYPR